MRAAGAEPFLVPAMGSHGGATAEGQRLLLGEYGMSEQALGMPIRATMDTVVLGELADGTRVYFDAEAAAADATIVVNRVKAHTAFRGPIESGLSKMTAIGLGKQLGAEQVHSHGLRDTIPAAASLTLRQANIAAGLALVENAAHQLAVIRATLPEAFLQTDEAAAEGGQRLPAARAGRPPARAGRRLDRQEPLRQRHGLQRGRHVAAAGRAARSRAFASTASSCST